MNILYVCHTWEAAKAKFHDTIKAYDAEATAKRISYNNLSIEFEDKRFDFISSSVVRFDEKIIGRTLNKIIVEEMVYLTDEQKCQLYSRLR